jgi:hypothetical protein
VFRLFVSQKLFFLFLNISIWFDFEWIDCVLASELRQYETWTLFSFFKIIRQLASRVGSSGQSYRAEGTTLFKPFTALILIIHTEAKENEASSASTFFLIFLFFFRFAGNKLRGRVTTS